MQWQCPVCRAEEKLQIEGTLWFMAADVSVNTTAPAWQPESPMKCEGCGFLGEAAQFDPSGLLGRLWGEERPAATPGGMPGWADGPAEPEPEV